MTIFVFRAVWTSVAGRDIVCTIVYPRCPENIVVFYHDQGLVSPLVACSWLHDEPSIVSPPSASLVRFSLCLHSRLVLENALRPGFVSWCSDIHQPMPRTREEHDIGFLKLSRKNDLPWSSVLVFS